MPSKSKQKGNAFEREVATLLTNLLSDENNQRTFKRTPGSGSHFGGINSSKISEYSAGTVKQFRGDIIAPDDINLIIECKNHSEFGSGFHGILSGYNKKLNDWLQEVYHDSNNNKIPNALFFKITGTSGSIFVALPQSHFKPMNINGYPYMNYYCEGTELFYYIVAYWVLEDFRDSFLNCIIDISK